MDAGDPESAALDHASLELTWEGLPLNNSIIAEIAWVANSTVLLKEVNRAGNNGSIVLFDLDQGVVDIGETTRKLGKDGEQGDDGWIDSVCNFLLRWFGIYVDESCRSHKASLPCHRP